MARYQLMQPWPIAGGRQLIPTGTILDSDNWVWEGAPLPTSFPINVMCLDQAAADEWGNRYSGQRYRFFGVPGVTPPSI
jgi:hypothetical protein